MNEHESYTDAELAFYEDEHTIAQREVSRRTRRPRKHPFRLAFKLALLLLAGYIFLNLPALDTPFFHQTATLEHGWNLILVNADYQIPSDYEIELVTLRNGQQVDRRIYPDLQEMFDTMRNEGVYPIVASGYRTDAKQEQLLNDKIQEYEQMGHSRRSARKEALRWVSRPGTSEHQLGIAVDINQEGSLSTAQEVYDWLKENAWRFGFIYRYPAEKESVTGVSNEPWHYRYVGKEAAREIQKTGLCLEEYLRRESK